MSDREDIDKSTRYICQCGQEFTIYAEFRKHWDDIEGEPPKKGRDYDIEDA